VPLYVELADPIQRYRRAAVAPFSPSRIQAQSRLRDAVQNVMAITDAPSRFWQRTRVSGIAAEGPLCPCVDIGDDDNGAECVVCGRIMGYVEFNRRSHLQARSPT
jgi:hypothetical protein